MKCAYRTAGIVRGAHPYALVVDDIRKDGERHVYDWQLQIPEDVTNASWWNMPDGLTVLIRAEDLEKNGPKKGAPCLAVLVLEMCPPRFADDAGVLFPVEIRKQLKTGTSRLVISTSAVEPKFKIALVPFNFGDAIPSATMANGTATLKWITVDPKSKTETITQQDEILFATDPTGRSTFTVKRAGATLLEIQ